MSDSDSSLEHAQSQFGHVVSLIIVREKMAAEGTSTQSSPPDGNATDSNLSPSFEDWVKGHGGDEEFLKILSGHGFKSTLSLSKFNKY